MHKLYAFLLPDEGSPEEIFDAAKSLIESEGVGGERRRAVPAGLIRRDGTVVPAPGDDGRWVETIRDLLDLSSREDWQDFLLDLAAAELEQVLNGRRCHEEIKAMAKADKKLLVRALAEVAVDQATGESRRREAAQQILGLLEDDWPYLSKITAGLGQRVYKLLGVEAAEAAIVLVDIDAGNTGVWVQSKLI